MSVRPEAGPLVRFGIWLVFSVGIAATALLQTEIGWPDELFASIEARHFTDAVLLAVSGTLGAVTVGLLLDAIWSPRTRLLPSGLSGLESARDRMVEYRRHQIEDEHDLDSERLRAAEELTRDLDSILSRRDNGAEGSRGALALRGGLAAVAAVAVGLPTATEGALSAAFLVGVVAGVMAGLWIALSVALRS